MGACLEIEIVVSDYRTTAELFQKPGLISVQIGLDHDFDDILDICGGVLDNEQLALVHRLWGDDEFPRTFTRSGSELTIRARKD